jgi:quercetin dioxygenase-like cupin family protein
VYACRGLDSWRTCERERINCLPSWRHCQSNPNFGKCGSVTLFAFDKDQALSEHTTPYDALIINIEGKVSVRISGINFLIDEGQMIIMPANKPHALKAVTRVKMMLIMIRAK